MKLPRDISGIELAKALRKLGYVETRQTGSPLRLTTTERGEHHINSASRSIKDWSPLGYPSGCGFALPNNSRSID